MSLPRCHGMTSRKRSYSLAKNLLLRRREPSGESDARGVGFVAAIAGHEFESHNILSDSRTLLERMSHRGACGCDDSGDGAGVLTTIPDKMYRESVVASDEIVLPPFGQYASGIIFLIKDTYKQAKEAFGDIARGCSLKVLVWRKLDTDERCLGDEALKTQPTIRQVFVIADYAAKEHARFEENVYLLRKQVTTSMAKQKVDCYVCSLSTTTIVYNSQFTPKQLFRYYKDLTDEKFTTHIALVHSRFSTNTFPSWNRAQSNRMLVHNGEINTMRGNKNLMRTREGIMKSKTYGDGLERLYPVIEEECAPSTTSVPCQGRQQRWR